MTKQLTRESLGEAKWNELVQDVVLALTTEEEFEYSSLAEAVGEYLGESWFQGILSSEWDVETYDPMEAWALTEAVVRDYLDRGWDYPGKLGNPEDIRGYP